MPEASSYAASNVSISWLESILTGLAGGDDAINAERNVDTMTENMGMQGDGVYGQSADKSGVITIKCLQNSATNVFLTKKWQATEAGVIASGPMICEEAGSDAGFTANHTVISKPPPFKRGMGLNVVEWAFKTLDLNIKHGAGVALG